MWIVLSWFSQQVGYSEPKFQHKQLLVAQTPMITPLFGAS